MGQRDMVEGMTEKYSRVYAEVDLDAVRSNIERMRAHLSDTARMMAVIKADGYGHGAVPIGRELEALDYMWGFAVATAEEALALRGSGIRKPVLVLGYAFPDSYGDMIRNGIRLSLFRYDTAEQLSDCAAKLGKGYQAEVHIKVDTGMSRIGIRPDEEGLEFFRRILELPGLRVEGIFTHFARADEADKSQALRQLERFRDFIARAEAATGYTVPMRHCSNSAGILELREADMDAVRAGISIYGLCPSGEVTGENVGLIPALSLKSRIVYLKEVEAGTPVSYGAAFVAPGRMRVATIPVGYGDGYPRGLSNKGCILLHGRRAPILGRVCMDQFMVDVSHIPQAEEGDEVTLIGRDGSERLSMEELGELSGRFNYELACCISKRVPRIYLKSGRIVGIRDYFQDFR